MLIKQFSGKICLIGDGQVGKTSLISRYVYDIFDDKYIITIGTKISRRKIIMDYPESDIQVEMNAMIWDIMGQKVFGCLLHEAYFKGARGIIAVCNLTNKESLTSLNDWVNSVYKVVGKIPIIILANKSDLKDEIQINHGEIKNTAAGFNAPYLYTSAKTGENVENAFLTIGRKVAKNQLKL